MPDTAKTYFTPEEVIARLEGKIVVGTLSNWRCRRVGPPFTKIGGRVLYPISEFKVWEAKRSYTSTSDYAGDS